MTIINDVPMELCRLPALQLTEYTGKQPTNGSYGMFLFIFLPLKCISVSVCVHVGQLNGCVTTLSSIMSYDENFKRHARSNLLEAKRKHVKT